MSGRETQARNFSTQVLNSGLVSSEQLEQALTEIRELFRDGVTISLPDYLVKQEILTAEQVDAIRMGQSAQS